MLATILLFVCAVAQGQHRGEIIVDNPNVMVTVITQAGDVPQIHYGRPQGQRSASWVSSSDCVVIVVQPKGNYNYTLRLGDTLTDEGLFTGLLYTCPPSGSFPGTEKEPTAHHIYPNPTTGPLYSDAGGTWLVFDSNDRLVAENFILPGSIEHLPDGVYYFIEQRRRKRHRQKIIKKRCCQ